MKSFLFLICGFLILFSAGCQTDVQNETNTGFPVLKGKYMGQEEPDSIPKMFAPNFVSTDLKEYSCTWSKDGHEFYWTIEGNNHAVIVGSKMEGDVWTKPEIVSFSGKYSDMQPFISPDGLNMFYASTRPIVDGQVANRTHDIWFVSKTSTGWSSPLYLGTEVNNANIKMVEMFPTVANNGNLYYTWFYNRQVGIARSKIEGGKYQKPENLMPKIDTTLQSGHASIAPDESYMLFDAREQYNFGGLDLYVTFNKGNDNWTKPINLGPRINSDVNESCPVISPDGKFIFFTSYRYKKMSTIQEPMNYDEFTSLIKEPGKNGNGDIYWVSTSVIEKLKKKALNN